MAGNQEKKIQITGIDPKGLDDGGTDYPDSTAFTANHKQVLPI